MKLNLNSFLYSITTAIDAVEKEILNTTTNHSKRVAYIALSLAEELRFTDEEKFDLCAYAIMHDNGVIQSYRESTSKDNFQEAETINRHCIIGEQNVKDFPFYTDNKNIIMYHHETYNGRGYFSKKGEDIPLMSQLIFLADCIDTHFNLEEIDLSKKTDVEKFIMNGKDTLFSPRIVALFLNLSDKDIFWYNLEFNMSDVLEEILPTFIIDISYEQMLTISKVFSNIVDAKSEFTAKHTCELMDKAKIMANYYELSSEDSYKLQIAANLHDLGKLGTPNDILEKPSSLTKDEIFIIKKHASLTYNILNNIEGMEEIKDIAAAHHERLDGSGYPFGLDSSKLVFEQRLLASLDIYQALVEDRPYRKSLSHTNAIDILDRLAQSEGLDKDIVRSIDKVFSNYL